MTTGRGWTTRNGGQKTIDEAAGTAIRDLLDAERRLRRIAEEENRDLRAALQLAAYTFAGQQYDAEIRANQRLLDRWTPAEWMSFFERVRPVSQGWSDPKVLAERLRQIVAERDAALAEVHRLRGELALQTALVAAGTPPGPRKETAQQSDATATDGGFRWPEIPKKPPARYSRCFKDWQREGLALALVASGLSMRPEAAEWVGKRFGVGGRAGSVKRIFTHRLGEQGLLENEVVRVGHASAMFVWLTGKGREACEAAGFPVRESEYERLARLHGGDAQKEHNAAVAVFAYHARKRGYRVEVVPEVEGKAEPDAVLFENGSEPVYVEVELGREKAAKWKNSADLQGFVALCALNADARSTLVKEIERAKIAGRATDLVSLIQGNDEGQLWIEQWDGKR